MTSKGKIQVKNQFGDYEDTSCMSVEDWEYRWGKSQTQFHMPKVHPMLIKYYDTLVGSKKNQRIFVPLCGKSLDMKWLSDQGHEVVGLECAEKGCQEFFEEQKIPYTTSTLTNCKGKLFTASGDHKIKIYCCDFFEISRNVLGTFDCIWDRGSFVAIPVDKRKQYSNIIIPLMQSNSTYLLDCFLVDNTCFGGPPFDCNEKNVSDSYGMKCNISKLETRDAMTKWQESWGLKSFDEEVYVLKLK